MPTAHEREVPAPATERPPAPTAKYVAFAVVGVAAAVCTALIAYHWSPGKIARDVSGAANRGMHDFVSQAGRVASGAERRMTKLAEAFFAENIQHTFSDHITSIEAENKVRLLVATIEAEERIVTTSTRLWGTTTVEITLPATFRYSVSLKEPWRIRTDVTPNSVICRVVAPDVRPVLPVAFDTRRKTVKATTTGLRRDADERVEEVEREITPILMKRSGERARQARDAARRAIADFVRGWLVDRGQWGDGKFREVIIYFPDEVDANGNVRRTETGRAG